MADSRQLRWLIDYNQWADERVLSAIDGLAAEGLARPREAYFGTIGANLRHTLITPRIWLARWRGEAPAYDEAITVPWREGYAVTHATMRAFVAGLSDSDADRVLRYTGFNGATRQLGLAHSIVQIVNHGTAHRAETGLLFDRLGRSPGDLDYAYYCFEHP